MPGSGAENGNRKLRANAPKALRENPYAPEQPAKPDESSSAWKAVKWRQEEKTHERTENPKSGNKSSEDTADE